MQDGISVSNIALSQQTNETSGETELLEADGSLNMFWIDAFEKNGTIYLFGKVLNKEMGKHISCCVTVHNQMRNLYVLPRTRQLDCSLD
jgi:DNA polymerase alpha subunit A